MIATLWMFTKGKDVLKLQQLLNKNGAFPKLVEDGSFGKNTYNAVKIFQQRSEVEDDGIVGPRTWLQLGIQIHLLSLHWFLLQIPILRFLSHPKL